MLSYRFWRTDSAATRQIVGRTILLNKQPYTVIGVMPKGFESDPPTDLWLPLQADPAQHQPGPLPGWRRRGSSPA